MDVLCKKVSDMQRFIQFFETLHHICFTSKRIVSTDNLYVYEEYIEQKGMVRFYLFFGSDVEQKRLFPGENEAYCTFKNCPSTLNFVFNEVPEEIICDFGYVIHNKEMETLFDEALDLEAVFQSICVCIWCHEMRHEIQMQHNLPKDAYHKNFPTSESLTSVTMHLWENAIEKMHEIYNSYVRRNLSPENLMKERDAIITSFKALELWYTYNMDTVSRMEFLKDAILD